MAIRDVQVILDITGTQTSADVTIYKENVSLSKENTINQTCLDIYYQLSLIFIRRD